MKTILPIIIAIVSVISCEPAEPVENNISGDASRKATVSHTKDTVLSSVSQHIGKWMPDLIKHYIRYSENALIKQARSMGIEEECLFDQVVTTDTAVYYSIQIGHDVTDGGGMNPRFVTDQWIYIDTVKRELYEYDLPNDELSKWH